MKLVNSKDGTTLNSETLTLYQKENRGNAIAKKNDFVVLTIPEETASSATDLQSSIKKTTTKKPNLAREIISHINGEYTLTDNGKTLTGNSATLKIAATDPFEYEIVK